MMNNYAPFSGAPFPTRPVGFNTGMDQVRADQMLRQAQLQGLESMLLGNQQAGANLERYQGETPSILAEAEYKRQMAQAKGQHIPEFLQGELGDARVKRAKGDLAMGTLESDITTGQAKNEAITAEQKMKTYQTMMQFIDQQEPILQAAEGQGPLAAQAAWSQVLQQVPPEVRGQLPQQYSPQVSRQIIPAIRNKLVQSITHEQALALEDKKTSGTLEVADLQGQTQRDVANITQQGADRRASLTAEQKAQVKKIEQTIAGLLEVAKTRPLNENEQRVFTMSQQILNNMAASRASGTAMGFNFMGGGQAGFPTPAPVAPPGAPAQGQPPRQFKSEAEAMASGYKGEVIINGRRARID